MPERRNVKYVFIETTDGPAISWTSLFGHIVFEFGTRYLVFGKKLNQVANKAKAANNDKAHPDNYCADSTAFSFIIR